MINAASPFFSSILKNLRKYFFYRSRQRRASLLRAYRLAREKKSLHSFNELIVNLLHEVNFSDVTYIGINISSESIEQYVSYRLFGAHFFQEFLLSGFKPESRRELNLPRQIREAKSLRHIKINQFKSTLAWQKNCLFFLCYTIVYSTRLLFQRPFGTQDTSKRPTAFFYNLSPLSFIQTGTDVDPINVINYFQDHFPELVMSGTTKIQTRNPKYAQKINPRFIYQRTPFDDLSIGNKLKAVFFSASLFFYGLYDLLFKTGITAFLSHEILNKKLASLMPESCIAKVYLFPNSYCAYTPCWMEYMHGLGVRSVLYFYSINSIPFALDNLQPSTHYSLRNIKWPEHIVWNKHFGNFIRENSKNEPIIKILPPISMADNGKSAPNLSKKILVFGVEPLEYGAALRLTIVHDYYRVQTLKKFYEDLLKVAAKNKLKIVIKPKRHAQSANGSPYSNFIKRLSNSEWVEFCDPDISTHRLLENALCAISIPFTSTAFIANVRGLPSIYYDPTKRLELSQSAAIGIRLINDPYQLDNWVKSCLENSTQ